MKKIILIFILPVLIISCAGRHSEHSEGKIVRTGILKQGISMQAFLDVWGDPDRTRVITITSENQGTYASWTRFGGKLISGTLSQSYQQWSYEKFGVDLMFDGDDLVGWKTEKTVSQLKALAKPRP